MDLGFTFDRTTGKEDWLTPPEIIASLGEFHLDPCAPVKRPWDTAKKHYTILDNGLRQPWQLRIAEPAIRRRNFKMAAEACRARQRDSSCICQNRDSKLFPWVWEYASALLFIQGRIKFSQSRETKHSRRQEPRAFLSPMEKKMQTYYSNAELRENS